MNIISLLGHVNGKYSEKKTRFPTVEVDHVDSSDVMSSDEDDERYAIKVKTQKKVFLPEYNKLMVNVFDKSYAIIIILRVHYL